MKLTVSHAFALALLAPFAHAQNPTTYCTAGTSTNGCTPSISANVQPNTVNSAGCVITTSGVEGQKQGLSFYGIDNTGFAPSPWGTGGTSYFCVKPPTKRVGAAVSSGGVAGQCDGSFVINWDAFQSANPTALGNPWVVGQKVFVQSWYRDPTAPKTSNLSNALELTLRAPPPIPCASTISGMVIIPAGTFQMGSNAAAGEPYWGGPSEQPVHQVTISYCFWMGEHEVTQTQYVALMGTNPSLFPGWSHPVDSVSWNHAQAYSGALTAQQSSLGIVPAGYQYRLPTEAEWEFACRAGTTTEFNLGSALFCNEAQIFSSNHSGTCCPPSCMLLGTAQVRSYAPNAWGLYDMHGNVGEWCLDWYADYSAGAVTDPVNASGSTHRVWRGGGWRSASRSCRSVFRNGTTPGTAADHNGFRVVLAPVLVP